jgi:hypothetical protein
LNDILAIANAPSNVCGNSINVIGLFNPSFGNTCINSDNDAGTHEFKKNHWSN